MLFVCACSGSSDWQKYLPADVAQLDCTKDALIPASLNSILANPLAESAFRIRLQLEELSDNEDTGLVPGYISVLPEASASFDSIPFGQVEEYEGFRIGEFSVEEAYGYDLTTYSVVAIADALWIGSRLSIEHIIDNREYGEPLQLVSDLRLDDVLWKDRQIPFLSAPASAIFQLNRKDSVMRSHAPRRSNPANELSELLALIPRDAAEVRIEPDGAGQTFGFFRLLGESLVLASAKALDLNEEPARTESYQSFEIATHDEAMYAVELGDSWTLAARHPIDIKNFLDRLMTGSSLLDRPELPIYLAQDPDLAYLRLQTFRTSVEPLMGVDQPYDWWGGRAVKRQIEWTYLGSEESLDIQLARDEINFGAAIESWLSASGWPNFGLQLRNGQVVNLSIDSDSHSEIDVAYGPIDSHQVLAPYIQLLTERSWASERAWQKSSGSRLDAPMTLAPTYVYLPAYDESIVLLATTRGRLLAIRPNGSLWETAQGRSPSREGEPLVQSPVHVPGPDFDHIVTLDESGQLIFSDLEGEIIAQHDSLVGAKILPVTTDTFLAVRQVGHLLLFNKKTGAVIDSNLPDIGEGALAVLQGYQGRASDLLTVSGRSLRRISGDAQTQFLVQLPFEPSELLVVDSDHWIAYHQGTRRWTLYRNEEPLLSNQRSDLSPKLLGRKLLTVEGDQLIVYELNAL
ncbi:MAG: hypothetical protein AAFY91_05415 [Bacteroidota bacterium]